jgi:hypothetical protein
MSDTPETNKNLWDHGDEIDPSMRPDSNGNWVPEEFARRLERERDKWEETARLYCQNSDYHREMREKAERERDEARKELNEQKNRASYNLDLAKRGRDLFEKCEKERDEARREIERLKNK